MKFLGGFLEENVQFLPLLLDKFELVQSRLWVPSNSKSKVLQVSMLAALFHFISFQFFSYIILFFKVFIKNLSISHQISQSPCIYRSFVH